MKHINLNLGIFNQNLYLNLDTYNDLEKQLTTKYNLIPNQYYITTRNRLITTDWNFNDHIEQYYILHPRINGGMSIEDFFNSILGFFEKAVIVLDLIMKIPDVVVWFFVDVLTWLITDFLNPFYILSDLAKGILVVLRVIILGALDLLSGMLRYLVNLVFEPIVSNFWGYTPKPEERNPNDITQAAKCADNKKCVKQPTSRVPFAVLISTIILPPMGLFMELGLKGWMNIILCSILTLVYYFPGLIYALIILYC